MRLLFCALIIGLALLPGPVLGCAACYGQTDSPLAEGMNWGIFSLLGVVVAVLGGIATFFIYLARRAAVQPPAPGAGYANVLAGQAPSISD